MLKDRLRHARELGGLSQRELSELAGLSALAVNKIESQDRDDARSTTVDRLAAVLGLPLEWLIRGMGEAPTHDTIRAAVERARASRSLAGVA